MAGAVNPQPTWMIEGGVTTTSFYMSNETAALVRQAYSEGRSLVIKGYRTGEGDVLDLEVRFPKESGFYRTLVNESLEQLERNPQYLKKPDSVSQEFWDQCIAEKKASWQRTMDGEQIATRKLAELEDGVGGAWHVPNEPDKVVVLAMELVSRRLVQAAPEKPVKEAAETEKKPKGPSKGATKEIIDRLSPMNKYLGRLNLYPDKFATLEVK